MVDPGTRPRSWTSLALTLLLGLLASACQSAMSLEEAETGHAPSGRPGARGHGIGGGSAR
jgi:hypothetical protein